MKKAKISHLESHVSRTKKPYGDSYGTGIKNPMGKMRSSALDNGAMPKSKLKKPPKSLA